MAAGPGSATWAVASSRCPKPPGGWPRCPGSNPRRRAGPRREERGRGGVTRALGAEGRGVECGGRGRGRVSCPAPPASVCPLPRLQLEGQQGRAAPLPAQLSSGFPAPESPHVSEPPPLPGPRDKCLPAVHGRPSPEDARLCPRPCHPPLALPEVSPAPAGPACLSTVLAAKQICLQPWFLDLCSTTDSG